MTEANGTQDVHIHTHGGVGHLSLNRPKALHALTLEMCHAMSAALTEWSDDDAVLAVILDHAEGRGFCAGGDINLLRNSALNDGGVSGRKFFHDEYQLNHQLFTYDKPIVAFMDGITMGGGVGIAQPCKYRVATENTRFAMPETGIGLFPDVGGGWHLSRLGGRLGQFLALTGARLDGAECLWAGIATHYLPVEKLAEAKARIAEHPDRIAGILSELSVTPPPARIEENADRIKKHFASDRYEDILASLEMDDTEWAAKELATLRTKSPQTCKVALRQLATSGGFDRFRRQHADGIPHRQPRADPPRFRRRRARGDRRQDQRSAMEPGDARRGERGLARRIFAPLPDDEEWKPLLKPRPTSSP